MSYLGRRCLNESVNAQPKQASTHAQAVLIDFVMKLFLVLKTSTSVPVAYRFVPVSKNSSSRRPCLNEIVDAGKYSVLRRTDGTQRCCSQRMPFRSLPDVPGLRYKQFNSSTHNGRSQGADRLVQRAFRES
jgi:hypothetical protein